MLNFELHRLPRHRDPRDCDHVVLLDTEGRPRGTAAKRTVHGPDTPLHLGFSCHVVDERGRTLLTRRAATKPTWPGVWTNACCGHPRLDETLRQAVTRRLRDELGVTPRRMAIAVPDFTYRAVMADGTVEHEVCPVIVAEIDGELTLNADEASETEWIPWEALCHRAGQRPDTLSPWSVAQIAELSSLDLPPHTWFGQLARDGAGLDDPIGRLGSRSGPRPHPPVPLVDALSPVRAPVEEVLTRFLRERAEEITAIDPALACVAEEVRALVSAGGKRLRPAFVYWGHRADGTEHEPGVAAVAAAVEMLHTFALLHDDVMDRSATRRARPAAHRAFATLHAADDLEGDADWFGASAAILAGDLAFVWADQLLDTAPLQEDAIARARTVFTTMRTEVMAGQYLDLRLGGLRSADPATARRVALLKSGRYTVTRPLELGLALAGSADVSLRSALAQYGDSLGVAFQMRDDILGLFGDPVTTGKGRGDDLRAGKRTVLVLRALSLATPTQRDVLTRSLGDADLDDEAVDRCREIVASTGALASVETLLRSQHATAVDAITHVPEPSRSALGSLASSAVLRER